MSKFDEVLSKLEEEVYLSRDLEAALYVLNDALSIYGSNKTYVGAVEVIRRSINSHNNSLQEILKEIRLRVNNEDSKGIEEDI